MAINTDKSQAQAAELSSQLWSIANDLRGGMDANEFRNYILGTIFYRYLSERTEMPRQMWLSRSRQCVSRSRLCSESAARAAITSCSEGATRKRLRSSSGTRS